MAAKSLHSRTPMEPLAPAAAIQLRVILRIALSTAVRQRLYENETAKNIGHVAGEPIPPQLAVLLLSFSLVQNAFADILNDATASGTYQLAPVVSGNSFVSIPVVLNAPSVELLKSSTFNDESGDGFAQLGETISYGFSVQNTGNVTLTNITWRIPLYCVGAPCIAAPLGD